MTNGYNFNDKVQYEWTLEVTSLNSHHTFCWPNSNNIKTTCLSMCLAMSIRLSAYWNGAFLTLPSSRMDWFKHGEPGGCLRPSRSDPGEPGGCLRPSRSDPGEPGGCLRPSRSDPGEHGGCLRPSRSDAGEPGGCLRPRKSDPEPLLLGEIFFWMTMSK
jgi:hypothetical protein